MSSIPLQFLDGVQDLYKSHIAPYVSPTSFACIVIIIAVTNAYLSYNKLTSSSSDDGTTTERKKSKSASKTKDIFDAFHRNKGSNKKDAGKKAHSTEKPFGSSYYYAHNDPNRTGGYKDGLRMEDYIMNGPKLLAKGGKRVEEDREEQEENNASIAEEVEKDGTTDEAQSASAAPAPAPARPAVPSNSVPIAKYMWDDTATTSGCSDVGKLYIDTLPNKPSTRPDIKWECAGIKKADVTAQLLGDDGRALLICITRTAATGTEPRSYHLFIRRMYGDVAEVKVVVKAKRLLVKLIKKRNQGLKLWDKSNLKPWPQLSEKGTGGGSDDAGFIDEDMFKRDVSNMPQAGPPPGSSTAFDEKLFGGNAMGNLD